MRECSRLLRFLFMAWICLPLVVTMSGCGGCRDWFKPADEAEKEKELDAKKEKPKPDFESMKVTILPGTIPLDDGADDAELSEEELDPEMNQNAYSRRVAVKPGHWVHARYELKANNFDFSGELTAQCVDTNRRPHDLERSPFWVTSTRPAVLPKAQSKQVELPIFVSVPSSTNKKRIQLHAALQAKGSGRAVAQDYALTVRLKPHQYHLAVLARNPDRYGWLRSTQVVKPPVADWAIQGIQEDYLVTFHPYVEGEYVPLPGNPLAWTSIAYVLWDDMPVDSLNPDQQVALIDWLHWGGQLIVSGPASLDALRTGFLEDYLPAEAGKIETISQSSLDEINRYWALIPADTELDESKYRLTSSAERPIEIMPLSPIAPAQTIPRSGGLAVERKVGRGRIVVTGFGLGTRQFVNWQNFDGFLNGCLMRRPGRRFRVANNEFPTVDWSDYFLLGSDARLNCQLRYFSRDAAITGIGRERPRRREDEAGVPNPRTAPVQVEEPAERTRPEIDSDAEKRTTGERRDQLWGLNVPPGFGKGREFSLQGYYSDSVSGVGGWSDFTPVAQSARQSLQQAAGVEVPDSEFVVKVLLAYVICLVPVNWLVFRLAGRVEWAWFAAPVIAIAGAFGVAKLAELDIGFVRSRTEIAIVEMQPEYTRAHLTRYCGFYTSLTSQYGVTFEDSRAHALPFSLNPAFERLRLQSRQEVSYVRDKRVGMTGYPVLSNSTGMVHVEQMVEMTGQLQLLEHRPDTSRVMNDTPFDLNSVVLVTVGEGGTRIAVTPNLASGEQAEVVWGRPGAGDELYELLRNDPTTAPQSEKGTVNLREIYRLAVNSVQLHEGDVRLVGWSDQVVEGMDVRPRSNQQTYRTVFVSHLRYGTPGLPETDENHFAEVQGFGQEEDTTAEEELENQSDGT